MCTKSLTDTRCNKTRSRQTGCLNYSAEMNTGNSVGVSKDIVEYCNNLRNIVQNSSALHRWTEKRVVQVSPVRSSTTHRGIVIRSRIKAGSDNPNNRCPRAQQQRQRALPRPVTHQPQPVAGRRLPVWGAEADRGLTPLRDAYRGNDSRRRQQPQQQQQQRRRDNPSSVGAAARAPSRIPVARKRAEQPSPCKRLDRPVEHYHGSKLPVPERRHPAPKRIRRPERQHVQANNDAARQCDVPAAAQRPRGSDGARRRLTYDTQPSAADECPRRRRSTCDVSASRVKASECPKRRSTYDTQTAGNSKRDGTYEVPQCSANVGRTSQCNRYDVAAPTVRRAVMNNGGIGGLFSLTGTYQFNVPGNCSPRGRRSDRDAVQEYFDNQMEEDVIAPRELAVPGTSYRHIDSMESNNTTPQSWREMLANRSSIEPEQGMSIGSSDCGPFDSRPFGLDDSFLMLPPRDSASRRRRSRAATVDHECRPAPRCRRRDTFDRNTC